MSHRKVSFVFLVLLSCGLQIYGAGSTAVLSRRSSNEGRRLLLLQQQQHRTLQQAAAGGKNPWSVLVSRHVDGQDLECNQESVCKLCGRTVADYAQACQDNPKCEAFVTEPQDPEDPTGPLCAYLKGASKTIPGDRFVTYCKPGSTDCTGELEYYPNTDMPQAGDFKCGSMVGGIEEPACFKPGTVQQLTTACTTTQGCKAFVATDAGHERGAGGWLKNTVKPLKPQTGLDVYVTAFGGRPASNNTNSGSVDTEAAEGPNSMVGPPSSPANPSPADSSSPSSGSKRKQMKLSKGAIIGIAVGGGVGLLLLLGLCLFCLWRKKKRAGEDGKAMAKPVPVTATAINNQLGLRQYSGPTTARVG